ncbi:unnamed protein product [Urochloa humidicola]
MAPVANEQPAEAALEGLAMGGLVAILRHLGDLAELAAEVFDGLQDQAVDVSARARRLTARAKQLQADLDKNEHCHLHLLCQAQTRPLTQRHEQQRLNKVSHGVAGGEAPPRSIVNHIKRCRGPPGLSALDRFDAHGDGACLKRYTNPSFFRAAHSENACSANRLHQADSDDTRSRTGDSEKKSLGFLSMLRRQLKHRQTAPSLEHQTCTHKSSAERRDSSADHSDTDISFTASSPAFDDMEMDKASRNHPSTSNCCSDAAGSDYVGSCSELQRTSSFEAWLSPGACSSSADPVFSIQDSVPESEESFSYQETTRLQRTYDGASSVDAEKHGQQNCPSISNHCSNSSSPVNSGEPDAIDVSLPRIQRTGCETDKSLHTKLSSVLPENTNSSKVDAPPLLPIPPMQWLSVKVHTRPIPSYRNPFRKDHVQRFGSKILKNTELSGLAIYSYEGWSGAEIHSQQESRQQLAAADTDRPTEKVTEDHQVLYHEGAEMSSCGGNTVSDSKANKHATQVDVQRSGTDQGHENVFFSAVEQLSRMSPPWIPRPKHPLPEVASCDRITLRNGPSPIHGSRSILDCRTTLVGQIKDKVMMHCNGYCQSRIPISSQSCDSSIL